MGIADRAGLFAFGLCVSLVSSAQAADYPITVRGGDEASFTPALTDLMILDDPTSYDVIVVGAGLGGLSSALYLSDQGKRVLLLEKEATVGGLATSSTNASGTRYDRGAAYWTDTYEEEQKILDHIGLGDFATRYAIHEPIDSYFWKGELYSGIWDEQTLNALPSSFSVFKYELEKANDEDLIPNQPLEEADHLDLDAFDTSTWIRMMPARLAARQDPASKALYQRFLADPKVNRADPMKDVIGLMDLYCRSALGTNGDQVSALAFANFYISEIVTRYTTQTGTAGAAERMEGMLRGRPELVTIITSAPVGKLKNLPDGVEALYSKDGRAVRVHAKYAVFAAELKIAEKVIDGFDQADPERAQMIRATAYANYSVHNVQVKGHPYRASYDTWVRADDYTENDFTDFILGRWMDPAINGYEGMRDFARDPVDNEGIVTIYHPLPQNAVGHGYTDDQAKGYAESAVNRLLKLANPMLHDHWGTKFEVVSVETNRWPYSVHIAKPGHFSHEARVLRRRLGRVFFANNNLGTPAFEEALFRGHCAADNVLSKLVPGFQPESWSKCPIEQ